MTHWMIGGVQHKNRPYVPISKNHPRVWSVATQMSQEYLPPPALKAAHYRIQPPAVRIGGGGGIPPQIVSEPYLAP